MGDVGELDRRHLATHPWSLTGGGAVELMDCINQRAEQTVRSLGIRVGGLVTTGEDAAFEIGGHANVRRRGLNQARPLIPGEAVKDYAEDSDTWAVFPYSTDYELIRELAGPALVALWPSRTILQNRRRFGTPVYELTDFVWYQYRELYHERLQSQVVVAFVKISTHNHAIRDHQRSLFREACHGLIASDDALMMSVLGVLNSSTACFWLKQNSHNKGSQGVNEGIKAEPWERFYEFTGTTLQNFPLPASLPLDRGQALDRLAVQLKGGTAQAIANTGPLSRGVLDHAARAAANTRAEMIAQQEELDWEVYQLYGLVEDDLTYNGDDLPGLVLGERAFEIVLARGNQETAWFDRHGSTPVTEIPQHWPAVYRDLVERRIALIESHPYIRLLEQPEYKRRWAAEPWEKQEERALRGWLLDRLEDKRFWFDRTGRPAPRSIAHLADDVARDPDLVSVLALWEGRPDLPVTASLQKLLADEAVPYLAAYRYKDTGLRKREAWEHTWALQRREDRGDNVGTIPVPPKYASADFVRKEYWAHRGKLDVPKERFILYPDAGRRTDPTPVLGWAGWDHAQQALALETLIQQRETEGWDDKDLIPLVAGLAELLPWVEQWHTDKEPFYGGVSPAEFFREQLDDRARQVERTREQLAAWRPEPARRGRARKASST
jgi:hypothetical protein